MSERGSFKTKAVDTNNINNPHPGTTKQEGEKTA
jgi:hypothetical protein